MGAFNNPNEILLDCDIDPLLESKEKKKEDQPASLQDFDTPLVQTEQNTSKVDEKGEVQLQTQDSSSQALNFVFSP